jgi:hypothetical protein
VTIAHQPVTAPAPVSTRPSLARIQYGRETDDLPPGAWTAARIVGLVAATACCAALATAVVVGTALFALMNVAG